MNEFSEVKCKKCGGWWPKSYLIDGLCAFCDGRMEELGTVPPEMRPYFLEGTWKRPEEEARKNDRS